MTVDFPAPLVPSRAVIWSLWKVKVRSRTAAWCGSYSLVTDTRVTPGGPPSCFPGLFCGDDPAGKMKITLSGPKTLMSTHIRSPSGLPWTWTMKQFKTLLQQNQEATHTTAK